MNILIDFLPFQTQGGYGGAASFAKAVYDELSKRRDNSIRLFATYDSTLPVHGRYHCTEIAKTWDATLLDISKKTLANHIQEKGINVFFIAIGQFYERYNLSGIGCKTIMFIHDIFDVERCDNRIDLMLTGSHYETSWRRVKRVVNLLSGRWGRQQKKKYQNIMPLFTAPTTIAYTVSEYTRNAISFYFPSKALYDIRICYSPLREAHVSQTISNGQLEQLIRSGKPYLLVLAANRIYKNAALVVKVFDRLQAEYPDLHLLTLNYGQSISPRHLDIDNLSDSDLEHAYQHAHALVFASFFEGFGYPPIEAAKYGTPTVASNATSIPEILGDAGIYFSPFYAADLYRSLKLVIENRTAYTEAARKRYEQISQQQQENLQALIEEIIRV